MVGWRWFENKEVELAKSWREVARHRQWQSFQIKFIPRLEKQGKWVRKVGFWLGVSLLVGFLGLVIYLSAVSVVLNVRYYASEWMRDGSRGLGYRMLDFLSFKVPVGYVSKYGTQLSIVIPRIGVDAPIIPNVDPLNYRDYMKALKKGVAHAKGTYLPGEGGRSYLFAHSTNIDPRWVSRYNAVFYLLSKLKVGDKIYVWNNGTRLDYEVKEIKITGSDDTAYLSVEGRGDELILQTCYPPGTALKRLLVISELIGRRRLN